MRIYTFYGGFGRCVRDLRQLRYFLRGLYVIGSTSFVLPAPVHFVADATP